MGAREGEDEYDADRMSLNAGMKKAPPQRASSVTCPQCQNPMKALADLPAYGERWGCRPCGRIVTIEVA